MSKRIATFTDFYPFYLEQHQNRISRRLHVMGTALVIGIVVWALWSGRWSALWLAPLCGYGFAWVGHFFFENNRPATFQYPIYSLMGDFKLFFDCLSGRQPL
ncbi:MAG: Mpo1-like protein [Gammaproteobacteria bacterium]